MGKTIDAKLIPQLTVPELTDPIEEAMALISLHIPANTKLSIELNDARVGNRYLFRLEYTSKNSGRKMCMVAKGDTLPTNTNNMLNYYIYQLVLTPQEAAREFSRIYFFERRARQEAFLSGGSTGKENIRVSGMTQRIGELDGAAQEDRMIYEEYA